MLSTNRCKNCGGDVEIDKTKGIGKCQYCGEEQPLSAEDLHVINTERNVEIQQKQAEKNEVKKRRRKKIFIVCAFILAAELIAIIYFSNRIVINDIQMTSALNNGRPADEVYTYATTADELIMYADIYHLSNGDTLQIIWKCNGDIVKEGDVVSLNSDVEHIYSTLERTDKRFDTGTYTIEFYINGKDKSSKTFSFKVE